MTRRTEAKKGGSGQIFELPYFQNRKEFAADFFCVFILPIDEQTVWIWAKSEGVTCQLFWKVVHLAWNDPFQNKTLLLLVMFYRHNKIFWYQFCNFKHFLKAENSEDSLASWCVEFSIGLSCNPVCHWVTVGTTSSSSSTSWHVIVILWMAAHPYAKFCIDIFKNLVISQKSFLQKDL